MSSIASFFKQLSAVVESGRPPGLSADDIERVSAVLLLEIARADHILEKAERDAIVAALSASSSMAPNELEELVDEAIHGSDTLVSLHEHVSIVNDRFSREEKIGLVQQMWRVALADGDLDRYEDYTIRKICDLLYVKHSVFMQAKHTVLEEMT